MSVEHFYYQQPGHGLFRSSYLYYPTGTDNCGLSSIQLTSGLASGSAFPVGTTTNVWRATDLNLNTATCSFTVTVSDITAPTITCPANVTANNSPSTLCSAAVTYTTPSATDNCSISTVVSIGGLASGATYPVGVTTNTWRATDLSGNTKTCSFTVTVTDATAPVVTCPANIIANNSPSTACSATVTYTTPTASDNCGVSTVVLQSGLASGATYPVGVTTNVWRATDINTNTGTCSFTVTVKDVTLPGITCPANIVRNNDATKCSAVVTYTTPSATDNCGISTVALQSGLASGSVFPVGNTTNIWLATDVNTNTSTCSFTVKVNDVEPPSINCPANVVEGSDPGQCSANLGIYIGTTTFQDNCGVSLVSNNSPGVFQVGTTTVIWKATDFSNNTATCAQSITIEDQEWPAVKCPSNFNVKTDEGNCVATINYTATATDNCPGLSLNYSIPSPGSFDIGYTNVQVTATDASGHSATCEFQILVNRRAEICNGLDDNCDGVIDEAANWPALAKRFAADGVAGEEYGTSVDVQGDYAIVGSNQKTSGGQNIGSAYILFRDKNGTNKWGQEVELVAPGLLPGDNFGASVAIYGDYAAVGAPLDDEQLGNEGTVYLFHRNGIQWNFVKKIFAADPKSGDNFGSSLALEGDHLLVGSSLNDASGDNSGAAYMFYRNQGGADQWGQVAKLKATTGAADDNFGVSVDLDGDRAIVGANGVDGLYQNAGAAYIFGRNQFGPDAWGQIARIRANQAGENDNFGGSVGISGPWAIVGADRNDLKGTDAGAVFVFSQNKNGIANSWGQSQIIFDVDGQAGNRFGSDVGVEAPYAVVASKGDSPFGQGSGGGFVYLLEGSTWVPADQLTDGGGHAGDALGSVASISGQTVILGAPLYNNGQNSDQGAVVIFGGLCNDAFSPEIESRDQLTSNLGEASVNCFPIPFSDVLNIEVKGMRASEAQLTIVNTMGQIVTELYKGAIDGDLRLQWRPTASTEGLYFLRMTSGTKVVTKAIVQTR
ncbi:MAG: HYR domain-containing protein [Bacteroidota bacterium]